MDAFFRCIGAVLTMAVGAGAQTVPHSLEALLDGSGFVKIAAGEFLMGSDNGNDDERPRHRVRISRPFEMSRFEVTQAQWDAVMGRAHGPASSIELKSSVNPSQFRGPSLPVENLDWNAVQGFMTAINARDPQHTYRLPTEAEWEYAARAGTTAARSGWCAPESDERTHPVGEKAANAWGLHDMLGNVMEWVQDWYAPDAYADNRAVDPAGPASGSYRVYRGGGWHTAAKDCRPAFRGFDLPANSHPGVGFRVVRTRK